MSHFSSQILGSIDSRIFFCERTRPADDREDCHTVPVVDNYLVLLSHVTRQNIVEAADLRTHLGVDEEYEDIDTS